MKSLIVFFASSITENVVFRAGKIWFSGAQNSVLLKASSGECCEPGNFVLCVALWGTCSPHRVPHRAPNEIGYGNMGYGQMKQGNNILQFPHIVLKGYPGKGNLDFASQGKLYITGLWS